MIEEFVRFVICSVFAGLLLFATALLLSGCESAKYYECVVRDNTSNPCN